MTTEAKINSDFVVGAIRYKGDWGFYFMPPIYWATDADYYDPDYDPSKPSDSDFRGGVGKLTSANAEAYLQAIMDDFVSPDWVKSNYAIYQTDLRPVFLLDIDNNVFVSGFYDVDYENHVAPGWQGIFGDPLDYMPEEVRNPWTS